MNIIGDPIGPAITINENILSEQINKKWNYMAHGMIINTSSFYLLQRYRGV